MDLLYYSLYVCVCVCVCVEGRGVGRKADMYNKTLDEEGGGEELLTIDSSMMWSSINS